MPDDEMVPDPDPTAVELEGDETQDEPVEADPIQSLGGKVFTVRVEANMDDGAFVHMQWTDLPMAQEADALLDVEDALSLARELVSAAYNIKLNPDYSVTPS